MQSLQEFGDRYAEAWSSGDPASVAAFFTKDGVLVINDGLPAVGHEAIAEVANAFMTDFPDLDVRCDRIIEEEGETKWYWTMRGTNTGPGGTGKSIHLSGYEALEFGDHGLIRIARGHFDQNEWDRLLS